MSAPALPKVRMKVPEFLAWANEQPDTRYELVDGEIVAMAPDGAKDADLDSVRAALALAAEAPSETAPFEQRLAEIDLDLSHDHAGVRALLRVADFLGVGQRFGEQRIPQLPQACDRVVEVGAAVAQQACPRDQVKRDGVVVFLQR